jgi:hypothetical protein
MRILVGNNTLGRPGGSETYAYTLIKELVRLGHDVEAIAVSGGMISNKLKDLGIKCHFNPIAKEYDLLLLSHSSSITMVKRCKGFKIQTCHGVFPSLEQPVNGMDAYVSISQEVQDHLFRLGFESEIIHNGIDCDRFKSKRQINTKLKSVLSLCHGTFADNMIKEVCQEMGLEFIQNSRMQKPIFEMENVINKADLVVSLGRGCYESMACGRNVLILDSRNYVGRNLIGDGMLLKDNIRFYLQNNCSGRYINSQFNKEQIKKELRLYSQQTGIDVRKFSIFHLNIKNQAIKYLNLVK